MLWDKDEDRFLVGRDEDGGLGRGIQRRKGRELQSRGDEATLQEVGGGGVLGVHQSRSPHPRLHTTQVGS